MDAKRICKIIVKIGGELVRTRGSHRQYRLPNGNLVTVPYPKKDIPVGTLRSIERQAGIIF
jgi:toxin-antitoxin system, toxin component, hicA family